MRTLQIVGDTAYGGATYLILAWCRYLIRQGCEVDVFATDSRTKSELQKIPGLNIVDGILIPRNISVLDDISAPFRLIRLFRSEKYDVVHTYTATPGFLGRVAAQLANVPVILHHQAGWSANEASSWVGKLIFSVLESIAVAMSSRSICVSHAVRNQSEAYPLIPKSKLITICNGIETGKFRIGSPQTSRERYCSEFNIPHDSILIGNTGRLASQKDNASLIRGVKELLDSNPGLKAFLLLAGDGPEREDLLQLAESLGIEDRTRFFGFRSDIPDFLNAIGIFVNPSLWEGLSISLMEAMAAAKPIVTTRILPNAELIEHERSGLLVDVQSPHQIAESILRFIDHPDFATECAERASEKVKKDYTLNRMFTETLDLYRHLLPETREVPRS